MYCTFVGSALTVYNGFQTVASIKRFFLTVNNVTNPFPAMIYDPFSVIIYYANGSTFEQGSLSAQITTTPEKSFCQITNSVNNYVYSRGSILLSYQSSFISAYNSSYKLLISMNSTYTNDQLNTSISPQIAGYSAMSVSNTFQFNINYTTSVNLSLIFPPSTMIVNNLIYIEAYIDNLGNVDSCYISLSNILPSVMTVSIIAQPPTVQQLSTYTFTMDPTTAIFSTDFLLIQFPTNYNLSTITPNSQFFLGIFSIKPIQIYSQSQTVNISSLVSNYIISKTIKFNLTSVTNPFRSGNNISIKLTVVTSDGYLRETGVYNLLIDSGLMKINSFNCSTYQIGYKSPCKINFTTSNSLNVNSQIRLTYPTLGWMTFYSGSNTQCTVVSSSPQINSIFQCRYNDTIKAFVLSQISSLSGSTVVISPFTATVNIEQSSVDVDHRVQLPWDVGSYNLTLTSYSGDDFIIDTGTFTIMTIKRELFQSDNNSISFSSLTTMTMTSIIFTYTLPNINTGSYNMQIYLPLDLSGQVGDITSTYGTVVSFDNITSLLTIKLGDITLQSNTFTITGFKTYSSTKSITYNIEFLYQSVVCYYFSIVLSIPQPKLFNSLTINQASSIVYQSNNLSATVSELSNGDILIFGTTDYQGYQTTSTTWCSPVGTIINCNSDNSITVLSANNADQALKLTQFNFIIINSPFVGKSNFFLTLYDSTKTYMKQNGSFFINVQQMNTINLSSIIYTSSSPYFNEATTLTISLTLATPGANTLTIIFPTTYQLLTSKCITNCQLPTIDQSTNLFAAQLTTGQNVSVEFQLINPMDFTQSIVIISMDSQGRDVDYGQLIIATTCQSPCRSCSVNDTTKCLSCYNFSINKTLSGTNCLTVCPDGQYQITQSSMYYCLSCPSSCLKCTTNTTCQQCKTSYIYFNSTCISNCPSGYFISVDVVTESQQCLICTSPCKQCSVLSTNCSQCVQGSYLFGSSCLSNCPIGYYKATTGQCIQCSDNCSQCDDITGYCSLCTTNYYLYQNNCYAQCPIAGYAKNITSGKCQFCTTTCATCGQFITQCQYCQSGYFLMNGVCHNNCPNGYFGNAGTRDCKLCQEPCATCSGSQSYCQTCVAGRYLYNHQCETTCPDGTYQSVINGTISSCVNCLWPCTKCTDSTTCSQCSSPYVLNVSSCVLNCENGKFINSANQCQQCDSKCKTCNITGCIECSSSQDFLFTQSCVQSCSPLFKNSLTMRCQQCQSPCATCLINSTACGQCLASYSLMASESACYLVCPPLYYSQNSYCKLCQQRNPNCKQCNINNNTQSFACSTCQQSAFFYGYVCVDKCPQNTTIQINVCVSSNCSQIENCQLCSDLKCISCQALYTLENNACSFKFVSAISNLKAPFPFLILVLCTILSSIALKIYFKKMYIPMYLYSFCGIFQIGCMALWSGLAIMTSRVNELHQPVNFYFCTLLIIIIYIFMNIVSFVMKFTLLNRDKKFLSWQRQDNKSISILTSLVGLGISFRFQLIMFSKLGNRESFSAVVEHRQKMFWLFMMSLASIFLVSLPVICLGCYLIYLQQQMNYLFFTCIQMVTISLIMVVLSILTYLTPDMLLVQKKDQYRKGYVQENFVQGKSIEGLLGVEEEYYEQVSVGTMVEKEVGRDGDISSLNEHIEDIGLIHTKLSTQALQMNEQQSQSMQHITTLTEHKNYPLIIPQQSLLEQQSRQGLRRLLQQTLIKKQEILSQLIYEENGQIMREINANFGILQEEEEQQQEEDEKLQRQQFQIVEDGQYQQEKNEGKYKPLGRIVRQIDKMAIIQSPQQIQQQQQIEQDSDSSYISIGEEYLQDIEYPQSQQQSDEEEGNEYNGEQAQQQDQSEQGQCDDQNQHQHQQQQMNSSQLLKRDKWQNCHTNPLNEMLLKKQQQHFTLNLHHTLSLTQQDNFLKQQIKLKTIQQNLQNIQKIKFLLQQLAKQQQQQQRLKLKLHQLNNDLSQEEYIKLREKLQHDNMALEDKLSRLNQIYYQRKQQRDLQTKKHLRKIRKSSATSGANNKKYISSNFNYQPQQKYPPQKIQPKKVQVQSAKRKLLRNLNSNGIVSLKTTNQIQDKTKTTTNTKVQNKSTTNAKNKIVSKSQIKTKKQQSISVKVKKQEKPDEKKKNERKRIISAALESKLPNKVRKVNQLEPINEEDRKSSSDSSSFLYLPILSQRTASNSQPSERPSPFIKLHPIAQQNILKQDNHQSPVKQAGFIRSHAMVPNKEITTNSFFPSFNNNVSHEQYMIEQEQKSNMSWADEQIYVPTSNPLMLTEPLKQDQPSQVYDLRQQNVAFEQKNDKQVKNKAKDEDHNQISTIQHHQKPIENINQDFQHWPIDPQLQERINQAQQLANTYLKSNKNTKRKLGNYASATLHPYRISDKKPFQLTGSQSKFTEANFQKIDTHSKDNSIFNAGRQSQIDFNYPEGQMLVFEHDEDIIEEAMQSQEMPFKRNDNSSKEAKIVQLNIQSKIKIPKRRGNRSVINLSPGKY